MKLEGAGSSSQAHAFKLALSRETYASVIKKLAIPTRLQSSRPKKETTLTLDVELCTQSRSFKITKLNSHVLPKLIELPFGSGTHAQLARLLRKEIATHRNEADDLRTALADLIEHVPEISLHKDNLLTPKFSITNSTSSARNTISHDIILEIPDITFYDEGISSSITTRDADSFGISGRDSITIYPAVPAQVEVDGSTAIIQAEFSINGVEVSNPSLQLFVHWGSYDDISTPWRTELARVISHTNSSRIEVEHRIIPPHSGRFGATFFYTLGKDPTPLWLGAFQNGDISFRIFVDNSKARSAQILKFQSIRALAKGQILRALESSGAIDSALSRIKSRYPMIAQGQILRELRNEGRITPAIESRLESLSSYPSVSRLIRNEGLGEIVFVSPEGPHAAAGGLAQVISGLLPALAVEGIPSTLIAPLYASKSGNKHRDAWATIREGVLVGGASLYPRYIGEVSISTPPEYASSSGRMTRYPHSIPLQVYEAFHASTRLILLFNPTEFTSLYAPLALEEQVRRSVMLSRAALEVIANPSFDISPSIIVSNDWVTAPVPALVKLDHRYTETPSIKRARTLHVLHNAGSDYHGTFPTRVCDIDLWQVLGLAGEHFFGFQDVENPHAINLTRGGITHADGVLTVSARYAQELKDGQEASSLHSTLSAKGGNLFGISNGIDTDKIRTAVGKSHHVTLPHRISSSSDLQRLMDSKRAARNQMQSSLGLSIRSDATILAITGRLAEQKGLDLLISGQRRGGISVLEEFLMSSQHHQIIVAGPPAHGDDSSHRFIESLYRLKWRFSTQVATQIEYISHDQVLSTLLSSSLLLMPSRFEPGGIAQLEALALGTPVVARNVGGLSNTLNNFSWDEGTGNAFLCNEHSAEAFANTLLWAVDTLNSECHFSKVVSNAFNTSHDWKYRVEEYRGVFKALIKNQ